MSRRLLAIAALVVASVAVVGGCQSYNFNPVGSCLIQPGQKQVKLGDVTTADILFVVDDSGSMDSKQQGLANSFDSFINNLNAANVQRVSQGLDPFDFHIAITTSSVFLAQTVSGSTVVTDKYPNPLPTSVCTPGVAKDGAAYPAGHFVAAGTNPKVLHFTKDLYTPTTNAAAITALSNQFKANVLVGSCGSGEEQHLQAGRLAMQQALANQQGLAAGEFPHVGAKLVVVWVGDEDDCSSARSNPIVLAGGTGDDSCVADKKLPLDQQKEYRVADLDAFFAGLVAPAGELPSPAHPYASFGAAFIVGAVRCNVGTTTVAYTPADWNLAPVCPAGSTPTYPSNCIAQGVSNIGSFAGGVRFFQLADAFRGHFYDVVEGTVCDVITSSGTCCDPAGFAPVLSAIADLVKAPSSLRLPSLPASSDITVLRIVDASGNTRKICTQRTAAGPVASPTTAEGWWFIACGDAGSPPAVAANTTTCLYINHQAAQDPVNSCEAQPGETYSAEYMGQIPTGGCPSPSTATPLPDSLFCAQALSGKPDAGAADAQLWSCYGSGLTGTCICK